MRKEFRNCQSNCEMFAPQEFDSLIDELFESYADGVGVNQLERHNLPGRGEVLQILDDFQEILFPGFSDAPHHKGSFRIDVAMILSRLQRLLFDQVSRSIRCSCTNSDCNCCDSFERSTAVVKELFFALPKIREIIKLDVAAAYAGDPAASSYDEVILSYPGVKAIAIQRVAHELYKQKIPLIPRMMTEYAHTQTGIDIHPGATLGQGVFIDHGTGVVIGETAVIGDNVRIYQSVTLGALSFPKDGCGMLIKGNKRHPTVGNNVTIYAGATVLGDITIGENSTIGGNVWLTESLPAGTKIVAKPSENRVHTAK